MLNHKEVDKNSMEYIIVKETQLDRFYLLLKIHKCRSNVPGRPVISNDGTATDKIPLLLDFHVKTIIQTMPHILEDTRDFLSRSNQLCDIPDNTLLVTFDVENLHHHIPHKEGLETMKRYLDKREDESVLSDSLYKLAKIILKHNHFEFGQDVYCQIWREICTALCKHFHGRIGETNI